MKQLFDDYVKASWGGKRDGAGRPSTGKSKKNLYVTDYEFELLKSVLAAHRKGDLSQNTMQEAQRVADSIIAVKNKAMLK
jgi:hypothetical protein